MPRRGQRRRRCGDAGRSRGRADGAGAPNLVLSRPPRPRPAWPAGHEIWRARRTRLNSAWWTGPISPAAPAARLQDLAYPWSIANGASEFPTAIVLYDAGCGFCRWALAVLLRWDTRRALEPLPIQSPRADRLLADIEPGRRLDSWHLIAEEGRYSGGEVREEVRYSGGEALAPVLEILPGGAPIAEVLRRNPGLADRLYSRVAANRGRLGRLLPARAGAWAERRIERRADPGSG